MTILFLRIRVQIDCRRNERTIITWRWYISNYWTDKLEWGWKHAKKVCKNWKPQKFTYWPFPGEASKTKFWSFAHHTNSTYKKTTFEKTSYLTIEASYRFFFFKKKILHEDNRSEIHMIDFMTLRRQFNTPKIYALFQTPRRILRWLLQWLFWSSSCPL